MNKPKIDNERGSVAGGALLWLLGVPLPLILLISVIRSC
jgi:hypothetical protein